MRKSLLCTLRLVDKHIERLESCLDFNGYFSQSDRFEHIGELTREREALLDELKALRV